MTLKRKSFFIVIHKKYDFFFESHIDFFIIIIFNYIKHYTQYFVFCKAFVLIQPLNIVIFILLYEDVHTIIVVGEVRGAEAIDMLQAMNTGHDGSLSTGHANSPKDMMTRLETMVLMGMEMPVTAIRSQISSAIDIVVHLARLRDKSRKVVQIAEVGDYIGGEVALTPLYKFVETGQDKNGKVFGKLVRQENSLIRTEKLKAAGYM